MLEIIPNQPTRHKEVIERDKMPDMLRGVELWVKDKQGTVFLARTDEGVGGLWVPIYPCCSSSFNTLCLRREDNIFNSIDAALNSGWRVFMGTAEEFRSYINLKKE